MWRAEKVDLIITKHAIRRAHERGLMLSELLDFLRRNKIILMHKNSKGYEILVPMKGRLVGDFEDRHSFIIKSFLYPALRNNATRNSHIVVAISKIHLPKIQNLNLCFLQA